MYRQFTVKIFTEYLEKESTFRILRVTLVTRLSMRVALRMVAVSIVAVLRGCTYADSSSPQLSRNLSRGVLIPPSPVGRLVKASRANPFTPKPEAVPSKLLQQTMKKKITSEISLNKVSDGNIVCHSQL
jgi:hypothetical protein